MYLSCIRIYTYIDFRERLQERGYRCGDFLSRTSGIPKSLYMYILYVYIHIQPRYTHVYTQTPAVYVLTFDFVCRNVATGAGTLSRVFVRRSHQGGVRRSVGARLSPGISHTHLKRIFTYTTYTQISNPYVHMLHIHISQTHMYL